MNTDYCRLYKSFSKINATCRERESVLVLPWFKVDCSVPLYICYIYCTHTTFNFTSWTYFGRDNKKRNKTHYF